MISHTIQSPACGAPSNLSNSESFRGGLAVGKAIWYPTTPGYRPGNLLSYDIISYVTRDARSAGEVLSILDLDFYVSSGARLICSPARLLARSSAPASQQGNFEDLSKHGKSLRDF